MALSSRNAAKSSQTSCGSKNCLHRIFGEATNVKWNDLKRAILNNEQFDRFDIRISSQSSVDTNMKSGVS